MTENNENSGADTIGVRDIVYALGQSLTWGGFAGLNVFYIEENVQDSCGIQVYEDYVYGIGK